MRARDISTRLCTTRVGSRRSGNTRAKLSAKPRRRSAIARSITPPFEVSRPPSKAAVTFLAWTAGNENGRIVSSVMAGVAFAVEGDGVGFATESYAASALYTTLASLSGALWRIRWVSVPIGVGTPHDDVIAVCIPRHKGPLSSSLHAISRIGGGYEAICRSRRLAKGDIGVRGQRSRSGLVRGKSQVGSGGARRAASQASTARGPYRF